MGALLLAVLILAAAPAAAARTLCWKTTSLMWDAREKRAVPVTEEMLARLSRAFASWERASGGALAFRHEGASAPSHDGTASLPRDGCVHAVLHGERNFHGELAHGGFDGKFPDGYERGYFFVSRRRGAADDDTLIHEIGHALGLPHSAVASSVMFSGPRSGGAAVSEQDAADLRARWARGAPGVFVIEGAIESRRAHPTANVFAVGTKNGRTYSARADYMGRFLIGLAEPGEYRLIARPVTLARDLRPAALGGFQETEHPDKLVLSASRPDATGVRLRTRDDPPRPPVVAPGAAASGGPVALAPQPRSGPAPVIALSFDRGFDDEGPYRLRAKKEGDDVTLVDGIKGRALWVGGTEDWLDLALSSAVVFPRGFTLALWVRRDDWLNPYRGGSGWQTVASLTTGASLSITAPGCPLHEPWAIEGHLSSHSPTRESARAHSPGDSVLARRWQHAAMVHDPRDASLTVYLDGKAVDRAKGAPVPSYNIRNLRLGTWYKANQAFRGAIDELEVHDYPRSADDIARAAAAGR
ncbi:MAG: LamG-like jellyroll fold domain-containing protein [Elusimicrobiota bacterium]|nr:LamG-like jellyroll fold domain-containing protein [Elusimicrobiota bacterium]